MLSGPVKNGLRWVLDRLLADPNIYVTVTYQLLDARAYNGTAKRTKSTYDDSTIKMLNISKRSRFPVNVGQMLEFVEEDTVLLAKMTDCPAGISERDKIVVDGKPKAIAKITPYFGVAYGFSLKGMS